MLIFFACFCIAVGDTINGDKKGCDPICTLDSVHVRISIALCRGRFCVHWFEVRDFVDIVDIIDIVDIVVIVDIVDIIDIVDIVVIVDIVDIVVIVVIVDIVDIVVIVDIVNNHCINFLFLKAKE